MSNPIAIAIPAVPDAEAMHQEGVVIASHSTDYEAAWAKFAQAKSMIYDSDPNFDADPSKLIQLARINRDDAFTTARMGLREQEPTLIPAAYNQLSRNMVSLLGLAYEVTEAHGASGEDYRYVQAEAGASIGLLGRLATLARVVGGTGKPELELPGTARQQYVRASGVLARGSNSYYAVSNAINAARDERIAGTNGNIPRWLGIATKRLVVVSREDPGNAKAALRTFGDRLPVLRSVSAARASVLKRP